MTESKITTELMKQMEKFWDVYEEASAELEGMGIKIATRPSYAIPRLQAEKITSLNDKDFATQYAQTNEWTGFVREYLAAVEAKKLVATKLMEQLESAIRLTGVPAFIEAYDRKPTPTEIKDMISTDPHYLRVSRLLIKLETLRIQSEARYKSITSDVHLLSRHVEIRRQEKEQFRVENNMPVRGFDPRSRT